MNGRGRLISTNVRLNVGVDWTYDTVDRRLTATGRHANLRASLFNYDDDDHLTELQHYAGPSSGDITPPKFNLTYGYDAEGNREYTQHIVPGLQDRSEAYEHDRRNRLVSMNRGILTLDGSGGATVEEGDFYSNPDPLAGARLKQKEDWVDLDRRGNWLEYGDSIDGSERVEKRFVNTANGYIDIAPDTTHENTTPCPTGGACPSPKYDFNGNMTFDPIGRVAGFLPDVLATAGMGPGQEFEYDFENRVTKILRDTNNGPGRNPAGTLPELNPLMEFVYDALGRRVQTMEYVDAATWGGTLSSPRTTHHVYLGLETIQEYSCGPAWPCGTGNPAGGMPLVREFFWGDPQRYPEPVAMIQHNPDTQDQWTYHYLHDVLGSVIGLVNSAGTLVERYTYDPYGKVFIEKWNPAANENSGAWEATFETVSGMPYSAFGNPWMWTGQRYDAAVETYCFPNRNFLPQWGRWGQRDPIDYAGGSINLYEYVRTNPMSWVDPLGLYGEETHYCATRQAALDSGFDPDTADAIANADQGLDEGGNDAVTQSTGLLRNPTGDTSRYDDHLPGAGAPWAHLYIGLWRFRVTIPVPLPQREVEAGTHGNPGVRRRLEFAMMTCDSKSFGEALHTLQDSYSHQGRPNFSGHPKGRNYMPGGQGSEPHRIGGGGGGGGFGGGGGGGCDGVSVPMGASGERKSQGVFDHGLDNPYNDIPRWREAMRETKEWMAKFRRQCKDKLEKDTCPINGFPKRNQLPHPPLP